MEKIRIAILDDHKLVRRGFGILLNNNSHFKVIAELENEAQLTEQLLKEVPDVLLLDVSMPDCYGPDLIPKLSKQYKNLKFIVLTMHKESEYVIRSIKNGANAYLLKDVEPEELERAIDVVHNEGKYINTFVSDIMLENLSKPIQTYSISDREKEVLKFVAEGLSTKIIADRLCISSRTVESHRVKIMKKVNAANTAELIKIAMKLRLFE